jgi:cytochrome d ubiquinol oxidase subunit I
LDTDLVFLSRVQFAVTIMFHYLFPPLTIGLGVLLVFMEGQFLRTRDAAWERATRFFVKLFAVNFVLGVATGIVMEFEFGTNWASYSRFVGDVFGSLLAAEGLWAFFLESGFLAILVFGWDRVTPAFHFFATLMVAIGSIFSAVWITAANSWMQTPAGFSVQPVLKNGEPWLVDGQVIQRAVLTDFFSALLNPSTANRISHVLVGALVMGGLFVLSVSAWYLLKRKEVPVFRKTFGAGLAASVIGIVGAMVTGDANARMVAGVQPAKLAAMEALAITPDGPAGLTVVGVPRATEGKDAEGFAIPGALSMLVYREFPPRTNLPGLDLLAPADRPNSTLVFWSFRAMVFAGSALLLLTLWATYVWYRNAILERRKLLWCCVASVLLGVVANQSGWVTAEVGRQPWIVAPFVPRVDPAAGVLSGLYLVRLQPGQDASFMVWKPGDPGANLAQSGWHLAFGHRIVADTSGQLRSWRQGDSSDSIVYDGTAGMRTSEGVSTMLHADTVATSLVLFVLIYAVLGCMYVVSMNHLIQKGPVPQQGA